MMHMVVFTLHRHVYIYVLQPTVLHYSFQAGGFKLPFIVMGSLLLSILPVVLVILPSDESKYMYNVNIHKYTIKTNSSVYNFQGLQISCFPVSFIITKCSILPNVCLSFLIYHL